METFAWLLYGLVLVGPFVVVAFAVLAVAVGVPRLGFKFNRYAGFVALAAVLGGAAIVTERYMLREPRAFSAACTSGTGTRVYGEAKATSYVLAHAPDLGHGGARATDATIEHAILRVAEGKLDFVEVEDWESGSPWGLQGDLSRFRDPAQPKGYFKVAIHPLGSPKCRWLLARDVAGEGSYRSYLTQSYEHDIKHKSYELAGVKQCVGIDYVADPSARYAIEFQLDKPLGDYLRKHEIRVVDRHVNVLVGDAVAYEWKIEGPWSMVAFWIGNGVAHATCPEHMLPSDPIRQILKL